MKRRSNQESAKGVTCKYLVQRKQTYNSLLCISACCNTLWLLPLSNVSDNNVSCPQSGEYVKGKQMCTLWFGEWFTIIPILFFSTIIIMFFIMFFNIISLIWIWLESRWCSFLTGSPSVIICDCNADYIVTLYGLRRLSGRPPDYTWYTYHIRRRNNIQYTFMTCPIKRRCLVLSPTDNINSTLVWGRRTMSAIRQDTIIS